MPLPHSPFPSPSPSLPLPSGHYVAHALKNIGGSTDEWVIFNDQSVAKSANPPLERGYMYLYERA